MIACDIFEAEASVHAGDVLRWRYWTDLPAGTRISIDISRSYLDHSGRTCLWTLHDAELTAEPGARGDFSGGAGEISVAEGDLAALQELEEGLNHLSSGMRTPPTDRISVSFVVGARQTLRAFGHGNVNLAGAMVAESGGINVVRASCWVSLPLSPDASPFEPSR